MLSEKIFLLPSSITSQTDRTWRVKLLRVPELRLTLQIEMVKGNVMLASMIVEMFKLEILANQLFSTKFNPLRKWWL